MEKIRYYYKKCLKLAASYYQKGRRKYNRAIQSPQVAAIISRIPAKRTIRLLIQRHRLFFGIIGAVIISLGLTVFSLVLYVVTGTSNLDLSRPGYEEVRKKVVKTPLRENTFDPNGKLDTKIINDYLEKYKKQANSLNKYDTFDPRLLDDAPLGLTPTEATAPNPVNP